MVDACRGLQLLFNFRDRAYLITRCHNRGEREREREEEGEGEGERERERERERLCRGGGTSESSRDCRGSQLKPISAGRRGEAGVAAIFKVGEEP